MGFTHAMALFTTIGIDVLAACAVVRLVVFRRG